MATMSSRPRGIRAAVRRIVAHGKALAVLERELAQLEMKRKAGSLGAGVGVGIAAGVFAFFAVAFLLAAAAAALDLVVPTWAALLIMFGFLLLLTVILGLVAKSLLSKGTPLAPERAIEEARLTKQAVRARGA
jgi:hypothetical protein